MDSSIAEVKKECEKSKKTKNEILGMVFEGGGVLGGGHIGALSALPSPCINIDITKVKYFCGSSVGSIIAGLCGCRLSSEDLKEALDEIKFTNLLDDDYGVIRDMYRLWTKYGYHKGDALEKILGKILLKYTGNRDITLKEVYEQYGSYLIITATEMFKCHCKTKYFTPESDPDEKLRTVMRYSSSYPFIFVAKNNYSDGGILDNYPIKKLSEYVPLENILGFKFRSNKDRTERPSNVVEFSSAIVAGLRKKASNLTAEELDRTIIINTAKYRSMDFNITEKDKNLIYQYGIMGAYEFFINKNKKDTQKERERKKEGIKIDKLTH